MTTALRNTRRYTRSDIAMWEILAQRLKHAREVAGYSQTTLARAIRTSQGILSAIEAGKRPEISAMIVRRLAVALSVSTDYLLGLTDIPTPFPAHLLSKPQP